MLPLCYIAPDNSTLIPSDRQNSVHCHDLQLSGSKSRKRFPERRHRPVDVQAAGVHARLRLNVDVDEVLVDRKPWFGVGEPGIGAISGPLHRRSLRISGAKLGRFRSKTKLVNQSQNGSA